MKETLYEDVRAAVERARAEEDGVEDALDAVVSALSRSTGGPYVLASALFRLLDREETDGRFYGSFYGTAAQDALLLRTARLVVSNANGCRTRFASILRAVAEAEEAAYAPVVAQPNPFDGRLVEVEEPSHYRDRARETARQIVAGRPS